MDHLPLPNGCASHSSVPFLVFRGHRRRFGTHPFTEFPALNGYDKANLLYEGDYTDGSRVSDYDAAAFVQEWLWFGLLSEFLETDSKFDES